MERLLAPDTFGVIVQAITSIIMALIIYIGAPIMVKWFIARGGKSHTLEPKQQPSKLKYALAAGVAAAITFVVVGWLTPPPPPPPPPSVAITTPTPGEQIEIKVEKATGAGSFFVDGSSTKVASDVNLRVVMLVHPAYPNAPGWWVYETSGTDLKGNWSVDAWYGDKGSPPQPGDKVEILAVVTEPGQAKTGMHVNDPKDIKPVAMSDKIRVTVKSVK